jgi:hypothetical protein
MAQASKRHTYRSESTYVSLQVARMYGAMRVAHLCESGEDATLEGTASEIHARTGACVYRYLFSVRIP